MNWPAVLSRYSPLVLIGGVAGYVARVLQIESRRRRMQTERMAELPIAVGNVASQQTFIHDHGAFLLEYPNIHSLLTRVFIRPLPQPPANELEKLEHLPDSDPVVVAFENKVMADRLVFYLGRIAADDFGELLTLSGNGYGIGALKIVRGMYERIVTAAYIAKYPAEARVFIEDDVIKKWTLWREFLAVMPELKTQHTEEEIRGLEAQSKAVRAKRKEEVCPKCRQPKTQEAWTRVTVADMAKKADPQLAGIYASCYLEGTFHSHPTAYSLGRRLRETEEGGYTFRETTPKEAGMAVILGHNLILRLLMLENEYFNLGLKEDIEERLKVFAQIWGKKPTPPEAAS